ncbi:MAG TPA: Crp/Fnr family transcriptional regulator [Ruminococcus sp.]|nr:Crp/Fnr family transcriptional regulator [Ruminococcus sp.]
MKKYLEVLKNCKLFEGISDKNFSEMFRCLEADIQSYAKNQYILTEGEISSYIGILLSGNAQIIRIDFYGNRSIIAKVSPSELFGESFACAETKSVPVNVIAEKDCEVMFIDSKKILQPCCSACEFHSRIIFNLMKSIAAKNLLLNQKIEIISKRTTREKLMTYLMMQAKQHNSSSFYIPYDRQTLADFLEVDRSGLSAEISKLRKENIIESKRNFFRLIEKV